MLEEAVANLKIPSRNKTQALTGFASNDKVNPFATHRSTLSRKSDGTQTSKRSKKNSSKEDMRLQQIKSILTKESALRMPHDLRALVPLMRNVKFFQERKIKEKEFIDVC
jgi:hypothetical protein